MAVFCASCWRACVRECVCVCQSTNLRVQNQTVTLISHGSETDSGKQQPPNRLPTKHVLGSAHHELAKRNARGQFPELRFVSHLREVVLQSAAPSE